jgi:WD40 repeat protein
MEFSPDGQQLVSGGSHPDQRGTVWDTPPTRRSWTSNGRETAVGSWLGATTGANSQQPAQMERWPSGAPRTGSRSRHCTPTRVGRRPSHCPPTARCSPPRDWTPGRSRSGTFPPGSRSGGPHPVSIPSLAFGPHNGTLATAGLEGNIRLWGRRFPTRDRPASAPAWLRLMRCGRETRPQRHPPVRALP